jgi:radical SAM superfamily enzyme YgiQ (UPF0313 family)
MLATSQTTTTPSFLMKHLLMKRPPSADGVAKFAPLGLRRIEAALLSDGFTEEEVVVVDPDSLLKFAGEDTAIVAVSSGEPAGFGMNSSTMCGIAGGSIYPYRMFHQLMGTIRRLKDAHPHVKVVLGGPGAWQMKERIGARNLPIDYLVTGYAEGNVSSIFHRILSGEKIQNIIEGESVSAEQIPPIRHPSTMGVVEISRGCGLGCAFCTIRKTAMIHLPHETIIKDVRTNVEKGKPNIAILSEDFFRYGSHGLQVNPDAPIRLLENVREVEGLKLIQLDHCNVLSVSQYSDEHLRQIRRLLTLGQRHEYPWVNIGVETASGTLLRKNGGGAKMGRFGDDSWADFSGEQVRRLVRAGFFPLVSLIIGLPHETEREIQMTTEWVERLSNERVTVFPVLYAPVDGSRPPNTDDLRRSHWDLIKRCYDLNFHWIPKMYWDNQSGAGVRLGKRLLMQGMGRGQVLEWSLLLNLRRLRSPKSFPKRIPSDERESEDAPMGKSCH